MSTKFYHIFNPDDAELCVMPVSTKFSHIFNPDDANHVWVAALSTKLNRRKFIFREFNCQNIYTLVYYKDNNTVYDDAL